MSHGKQSHPQIEMCFRVICGGNVVGLHAFVEQNPKSFGSLIPSIHFSGCEFEAFALKEHGGERRVCFHNKKSRQCEIPLDWTDLAAEDPLHDFIIWSKLVRAADLLELARRFGRLRERGMLTISEMARACGVSIKTVSDWRQKGSDWCAPISARTRFLPESRHCDSARGFSR
jgi:Family of unknown function (DUF5372)